MKWEEFVKDCPWRFSSVPESPKNCRAANVRCAEKDCAPFWFLFEAHIVPFIEEKEVEK